MGGKEFVTLRSTIQHNAVLSECVRRAEENGELAGGGAIFVDRDPKHFDIILTFLRNKTEGVAYNSKWADKLHRHMTKLAEKPKYVRLPTDQTALQDLFVEASHFGLYELQHQLCRESLITSLFSFTGGNPFEYANNAFKQTRRLALGLVGTGSVVATAQSDLDEWLAKYIPLPWKNEKEPNPKEPRPALD